MEVKDEEDRVKAHTQHANGATSSIVANGAAIVGTKANAGSGSREMTTLQGESLGPSYNGDGNQTKTKTTKKACQDPVAAIPLPLPKRKHGLDKGLSCFRS